MKRITSTALIDDLMSDTRQIILDAEKLEQYNDRVFQESPGDGKWNVAQILEHLNFYSRFYLAAIEGKLHRHQTRPQEYFTPGWFGNYFTKMMKPTEQKEIRSKMKALKSATPSPDIDGRKALSQFIRDQHTLLNLLQIADSADLGTIRVPTSLTKLISLKLGDTFRFFIAHEQRHMLQIERTLSQTTSNRTDRLLA